MTHRNFRDWENNIYFHCNLSNPSHERCSVPPSCCRTDSSYTGIFCGRDVLNLSDHEAWFRVHTGSCPDAANRFLKEHVMIIGGVCLIAVIVLAFIDMVTNAVIDEIDIIRKLYDHVRDDYAPTYDFTLLGVVYDYTGSSEEEKLLRQTLDRVNRNAGDDGEKPPSMAGNTSTHELADSSSRAPHLSLAIERLDPEDSFQSAKKGRMPVASLSLQQ
ncbi:hypothetical protein MRX96_048447 [Rhipicephalus microplus]